MARKAQKGQSGRNYLIEYIPHGASVKVTAIDPVTGVEVSIVGSAKVSQAQLNRVAVRKLKYVLDKKAKGEFGNK